MKGEHEEKKKARHIFADLVVVVCLVVALFVTVSVVYEYHRLDTPMPTGVVTALLGMWGGELLILAARQILGSDFPEKVKKPSVSCADSSLAGKGAYDSDIFGGSI